MAALPRFERIRRISTRRDVVSDYVLDVDPMIRDRTTFLPQRVTAVYDHFAGLWVLYRVVVRGAVIDPKEGITSRKTEMYFTQSRLMLAPEWVRLYVKTNRPEGL